MHAVFLRSFTIRIVEDSLGKIKWLLVDMILEWIKSWTSTYFQRISTSRPRLDLELGIFPETERTNAKVTYVPPNRALADHKQPPVSAIGRNINWRRGRITRSNHGLATRQMAVQRTYCNKNIWEGLLLFRHQIFSRWRIWTSTLSIISLFSLSHIRSPETGGRRLFPIYQEWNQEMRASRSWGSVSYFRVKIFRLGSVHENFVTLLYFLLGIFLSCLAQLVAGLPENSNTGTLHFNVQQSRHTC